MTNRTGQKVTPNESYCYRPECEVESSNSKNLLGKPDTLHVVRYPNGNGVYVWESEWPGCFVESK